MDPDFERLRKALASNVVRVRKELRLSQEQLAFEAGIDRTYVSQIERRISNPSLLVLQKLAYALQTNVVALLTPKGRGEQRDKV